MVAMASNVWSLFGDFMFFIRKFPGWYVGRRVITITHYMYTFEHTGNKR